MKQQSAPDEYPPTGFQIQGEYENDPEYLREVLKHIVEIGASLRLQMDSRTLLQRVVTTICQALRFRYAVLYLADGTGFFRMAASNGIEHEQVAYLATHPLQDSAVAQIVDERYRISDSYFLPAEAPIWLDQEFASYFVIVDETGIAPVTPIPADVPRGNAWTPEDLLVIPLVSGENEMLGFLTPDSPLSGLRPTFSTMTVLELFANQAAVVIEGARLYSELREAVSQAKESERVKNNFLMTASHELRTPLTAVQGYLELLGDYGETLSEESRTRFIQNARRGCDELVLLLGNVLDVTHLDVAKISFKPAPVCLAVSAELILEILDPIIVREARSVEMTIPLDLRIWVDELRLRQILLNLLGNALKYTPPGTRIALGVDCLDVEQIRHTFPVEFQGSEPLAGTFVVLSVSDWGPGIAPEDQGRLFTRFMRLETARTSSQPGAGLGLYLCRQLVDAMGGSIWMESSGVPGEGATFFVAFPCYRA